MQPSPDETVLVVEDDPLTADLLRELLQFAGYPVEVVDDGNAAVRRLEADTVGLVVLDLMLPGLDGLQLCRLLRARTTPVYLPIIMLTALAGHAQRHAGFAAGADDYVTKPFDADDLLDRVAVWMRTRQRLRTAHAALLAEQARLRELEHRALREQLAKDEAALAMARTASHELSQPLAVLLGILDLWAAGHYAADDPVRPRAELISAAEDLAARVEAFGRVVRFETRKLAGVEIVDIERAQADAAERNGE